MAPIDREPRSRRVASADDDRLGAEARHLPEKARDEDAALPVEGRLHGAREDESLKAAGVPVGDRKRGDALGERLPAGPGVDREAVLEPARDDESRVQLGT